MPIPAGTASPSDDAPIFGLGAAAGVAVLVLGGRPTGSLPVDVVLVVLAVAVGVWTSAGAPWWTLALLGAVSGGIAGEVWGHAVGAIGFMLAIWLGLRPRLPRPVGAASAAASVVALATIGDLIRFGGSTAAAFSLVTVCGALGVTSLSAPRRRALLLGAAVAGLVVVVGVAGLTIAALAARSDLQQGNQAATRGLEHVRSGEIDAARASFADASVRFRSAAADLRQPWAQLARLVPIAAQHRSAGGELSAAAAAASRTLETELRAVDLDALRIVDGRIDVDAVTALQDPMARVNATVDQLDEAVDDVRSGWLLPPVDDRLSELADDLAEQRSLGARTADALDVAPAMLGVDGERVYLVMFTTPAEARGQGGFMGNYAELSIDDGRIDLTDFGRHGDLSRGGARPRTLHDAPADWLARYGPFGFTTGPDDTVGAVPWANITMSPNFPSTAQVVAELYPQSGGRRIDGVLSLDVFALEQIVGLVGPLDVPGAPAPLDARNTASFLLVDQYDIDDIDARTDLLEAVALETVDLLLGGSAPDPIELGKRLHPMVEQRRLMAWSADPDEQDMLASTGLAGGLLDDLGEHDGIAVTVVNGNGNKIDTFLERDFTLTELDGEQAGRFALTLRFRNDPPLGLPDYVVGNLVGNRRGSSRLYVTVHTTFRLVSALDDRGTIGLQRSIENDLPAYSGYLEIAPGATETWDLELTSDRMPTTGEIVIQPQPLVIPEVWSWGTSGAVSESIEVRRTRLVPSTPTG